VGPTERTRGVRALDDVVLRLRALGVAGETAARTQGREVLSAGQHLVHVALVTGVEHDRVARRVEDPVQRDRQLDDAEVRPEVPTGLGYLAHQELTDLPRELRQLVTTQPIEVARTVNRLEQRHTFSLRATGRAGPVSTAGRRDRARAAPRSDTARITAPSNKTAQHVLQDAAVAVVVRLTGGVDAHDRVELDRLLALGRELARLGG